MNKPSRPSWNYLWKTKMSLTQTTKQFSLYRTKKERGNRCRQIWRKISIIKVRKDKSKIKNLNLNHSQTLMLLYHQIMIMPHQKKTLRIKHHQLQSKIRETKKITQKAQTVNRIVNLYQMIKFLTSKLSHPQKST